MKPSHLALSALLAVLVSARVVHAQADTGCQKDTDCKGDRVCDEGSCRAPEPAPPVACTMDTDCEGDLICVESVCTSAEATPPTPEIPVAPPGPPAPIVAVSTPRTEVATPVTIHEEAPPPPLLRHTGVAATSMVLFALQIWDATGSPGGYPNPPASGATYALMESSSIGGYVGHSGGTDYALSFAERYNRDGDGATYGMFGPALRGTSQRSRNAFQVDMGVSWTTFSDATSIAGFGAGFELFLGSWRSHWGFALSSEIDLQPYGDQTQETFTIGFGGGLER